MDNGLWTEKFSETPITGKVYRFFGEKSDIKKVYFGSLLNGKKEGRWTTWWDNGHKKFVGNLKDGKRVGFVTEWFENGRKKREGTYKDGITDGLSQWYENGQKEREATFNDEKLIVSTKRWNKDGSVWNKDGSVKN